MNITLYNLATINWASPLPWLITVYALISIIFGCFAMKPIFGETPFGANNNDTDFLVFLGSVAIGCFWPLWAVLALFMRDRKPISNAKKE
jgi:hypothetical protein